MKIILATLNAKYIHSALSLYYLRSFCQPLPHQFIIKEFTINEKVLDICGELHRERPDIIGFSCYIWNIGPILEICSILKKINPQVMIVLGGPEVSHDPEEIMADNPDIDYIVMGEGEQTLYQFLEAIDGTLVCSQEKIEGLVWRRDSQVVRNADRPLTNCLDEIPFPYTDQELTYFSGKIIYYEFSRGCPFNCQYCLSSTIHGVRYFSLDRVKRDLGKIIRAGVKQVKFVDRTFNCHPGRTKELLAFLLGFKDQRINFHFEIAADLLDQEIIMLMGQAPIGFFQVEIGVQSTNPQVLETIQRKMNFTQVGEAVEKLRGQGNVHLHLDLIAGLPGEDMASFENSFNEVYYLQPDDLQLGFLKLLKGSGLRKRAPEFGLIFQDQPPYEILATKDLSFDELTELKRVENVLEQYHNSRKYRHTLHYLMISLGCSPFLFFRGLADFWLEKTEEKMLKPERKTKLLLQYLSLLFPGEQELFFDLLKLDWLSSEPRNTIPEWLGGASGQDRTIQLAEYLPWSRGMTPKEVYKKVAVEKFQYYFVLEKGMISNIEKKVSKAIIDYSPTQAGAKKPSILFIAAKN